MSGYTIDSLRREGQKLATDQAVLQLRQEELRAPSRIQELARQQQFAEPSASKVLYLDGSQHALAMAGK
jgi:cell division protein FtsL